MADYDPESVADSWNEEQGLDGADDEQQEPVEHRTDQDENQANYSLDQSTHALGDSTPFDGATDDVGDYDPASVTDTTHAPDPQPQAIPKPAPQPAAKKPRTAGGFLVGDSDSEEDNETGPLTAINGAAHGAKSQAIVPPSPLKTSVIANSSEDAASNTPAQVNAAARAAVHVDDRDASSVAPIAAQPSNNPPHDRIKFLEDRVLDDPRGAVTEWLALMAAHRAKNDIGQARQTYERFLTIFPQAADIWVTYLEMELNMGDFSEAEVIFGKCLMETPNVALWTKYLDYIRRRNDVTDGGSQARQVVSEAYKFVIDNIGLDKDAGRIWSDYIQFIKAGPGKVGGSDWQDQQKMDQLRKAYQQATSVPIENVNTLWKEYDQFEMNLNKLTGRKYLAERSPTYMAAKSAVTALKNITQGLQRTNIPRLPPAPGFDGDQDYLEQVDMWKRWIAWERSDPLDIKDEQPDLLEKRILYTYNQALMALRFWPEMWADAAQWCIDNNIMKNDSNRGVDYLVRGTKANPESVLLAFKHGEYVETTYPAQETLDGKIARGQAIRAPYQKVIDTLYSMSQDVKDREAATLAKIEENFAAEIAALSAAEKPGDEDDEDEYNVNSEKAAKEKFKEEQKEAIKQGHNAQFELLSRTISFAWIALMRAMRRAQGKGDIKTALGGMRGIFQDARHRGRITSDVYVAAAQMEWVIYKEKAGGKIFERGAKLFPEDEYYTLEYIRHLHSTDDFTNARVLFETFVNRLTQSPEKISKTKALYAYFHKHESRFGELAQIKKLEDRMAELFPEDPKLAYFSSRFSTDKFNPIATRLIVSPQTQLRPKALIPSIEPNVLHQDSPRPTQFTTQNSPRVGLSQAINSPKRPLPLDDFDDNPPRKMMRGDDFQRGASPLKGAAGRRLDQQRRMQGHGGGSYHAAPAPIPRDITFLMALTPRADTYQSARLNPSGLVRILRETRVPDDAVMLRGGGGGGSHTRQPSNDFGSGLFGFVSRDSPNPQARPMSPYGGRGSTTYRQASQRPGSSGSYEPPAAFVPQRPPPPQAGFAAPPGQFDPNFWQQLGGPPPVPQSYSAPPPVGYPQGASMPPYSGYTQY